MLLKAEWHVTELEKCHCKSAFWCSEMQNWLAMQKATFDILKFSLIARLRGHKQKK